MKSSLDCVHCDKTFSTSSNLMRHHRKVHKLETDTSKKICQCDLCGRRFSSVPCLRRHQRNKHAIINLVKCDKCRSSFRSTAKYEAHFESCPFVAAVKNEIDNHSKQNKSLPDKEKSIEEKDTLVNCEVEDSSLKATEKEKYPLSKKRDAIACKKCLLTFQRKSYLFAHAIKCKGEKSLKTCPVSDECNFRYRLSSTLRTHLKSVHDCDSEPEMQCKKCLLTFARRSTLNDHIKICKGPPSKKLLTCPISGTCHFRARFKRTITLHLKKKHGFDIDPPCEMKFNNWDDFLTWKKEEEELSGSCFTSQSGVKNGKSFFYCQKDGTDKPHTNVPPKTNRTLKRGRVKTGAFCTAYIRFHINIDNSISVRYSSTHTHPVEISAEGIISEPSRRKAPTRTETIESSNLEPEAEIVLPYEKEDSNETVPENVPETFASSIATEVGKVNSSFGFKVHEDEMVTVLYLTESQELPEGIFEYVNSTDCTQDSSVIQIHDTDTTDIDGATSINNYDESTAEAVTEIINSHPDSSEVASVPDQATSREKIKAAMDDLTTLLENDALEESVLSFVLGSLHTCKSRIEGNINSSAQ